MKVEDILNDSWQVFKEHWVSYVVATGIAIVGSIFIITAPPLFFGLYYMAVKGLNGEDVEIADVFKGFNYLVTSWIYLIVAAILIVLGFMLLIIPGLLLIALLQYAVPLIMLKELGATDSIQKSINIGRENFTFTILLAITCIVISGVGNFLKVGLLVSIPFTTLCFTKATMDLTKE